MNLPTRHLLPLLTIVGGILAPTIPLSAEGLVFPGRDSAVSPDLKWRVTCEVDRANEAVCLYLSGLVNPERALLLDTDRYCELLWSTDSSVLALTDWEGSSSSCLYIVDPTVVEKKQEIRDLVPSLSAALNTAELEGHCYWEAVAWEAAGTLRIRAFGHTDDAVSSHAFCYTFSVNLRTHTCTLLTKDLGDHAEADIWNSKQVTPKKS